MMRIRTVVGLERSLSGIFHVVQNKQCCRLDWRSSSVQQQQRYLASFKKRGRRHPPRNDKTTAKKDVADQAPMTATKGTKIAHESAKSMTAPPPQRFSNYYDKLIPWIVPRNFAQASYSYSREERIAFLQRLPLWLALVVLLSWDQTTPFSILKIRGPSMLPTMAADGSEIWFILRWNNPMFGGGFKPGDLVGWAHPDHPEHVSCKRIIGVEGDQVPRYGQYVQLYLEQDPVYWGMDRPTGILAKPHAWWMEKRDLQSSLWWDPQCQTCVRDRREEASRTIPVPPGHVWVEADCPALGVDSRHFGPVPVEWIQGKVVARLWPMTSARVNRKHRPHPIPLDDDTLKKYNVYRVPDPLTLAEVDT